MVGKAWSLQRGAYTAHRPPQGATNFAIVSTSATGVTLVLFGEGDLAAGQSTHEIPLDPRLNRTGNVWHVTLPALDDSLLYGAPPLQQSP